jgi:predicted amidohydrolase
LEEVALRVREMADIGTDLVVLPELFNTGYDLSYDMREVAETDSGPTMSRLLELASELDIVIAATMVCRGARAGGIVNRAVIVDAGGLLASADKFRLWGRESEQFDRGTGELALACTPVGTIGVAVCYEAGFPETVRALAQAGADIIALPAAFGLSRLHAWDLLTRSRALENGCFVVAAGLCGSNGSGVAFAGTSRIVDPRGLVLAELADVKDAVSRQIDLASVAGARIEIPYLQELDERAAHVATRTSISDISPGQEARRAAPKEKRC